MVQFIDFWLMFAVMWGLYEDYSRSTLGHIYVPCGSHICSGACANNVKLMYISVPGHTVDCIGFIWGKYTDIVVSYVAFEGHINCCHIYVKNMFPVPWCW